MPNKIIETIERNISNRFFESHPFNTGSAGMEDFSKLYHITRKQSPEFIVSNIINEIDELLKEENILSCFSCNMKLLIFAMCICEDKLPEKGKIYANKIISLMRENRLAIETEVKIAIYKYCK